MAAIRMTPAWQTAILTSVLEHTARVFEDTPPIIDDAVVSQGWLDTQYTQEEQTAVRALLAASPRWVLGDATVGAVAVIGGKSFICRLRVPFLRNEHAYITASLQDLPGLDRHRETLRIAARTAANARNVKAVANRVVSGSTTVQQAVQRLPYLQQHLPRLATKRIRNPRRFQPYKTQRYDLEPLTEEEQAAFARLAIGVGHEPV